MPPKVVIPKFKAENSTQIASVGNAYSASKYHKLNLADFNTLQAQGRPTGDFSGEIDVLIIQCSAMSAGPAPQQIHYKMSSDSAGDIILFGANTGEISGGVTTSTKGGTSYRIEAPIILDGTDEVYLWYRTDQGTLTIDKTIVMWHE